MHKNYCYSCQINVLVFTVPTLHKTKYYEIAVTLLITDASTNIAVGAKEEESQDTVI